MKYMRKKSFNIISKQHSQYYQFLIIGYDLAMFFFFYCIFLYKYLADELVSDINSKLKQFTVLIPKEFEIADTKPSL